MSSGANKFDAGRVAMLARLELAPESLSRFQSEMEKIVSYVDQLTELDVEGIEPTAHAAPMTNVLREDQAVPGFPRDVMLKNAPGTIDDELVAMPQVLPGGGMA